MVNIMRWDPFRDLDELTRQVFGEDSGGRNQSLFAPATDVYIEDDKQMTVEANLPGFAEDDVDVSLNEGVLEIRAEKHETEEDKKKRRYVRRESAASFYRQIRLPSQADESKIDAHMEHGLLKVVVPFKAQPKPKQISVKGKKGKK